MKSSMKSSIAVKWIDRGREPTQEPDPDYPSGKDVDLSQGSRLACYSKLPYPAQRCGYFVVECNVCHYKAIITTAGRSDDPRSVKLPCKARDDD